jgi:DNA replication and repair protein RecF
LTGLVITSLTLSHFRSHKSTKLELAPKPIVLFGANGAGKTNVLEAVSLLSPGRGLRRGRAEDMARTPENIGWKVSAELHSLGHDHEIETRLETGGARQVRIDGKTAPQVALGRVARMVWLVPSMDRLWLEGADGRRRFLDRTTMSFEPGHADVVLAYEKAMRERNRLLKDQVRDDSWYHALEAQMAQSGAQIHANRQQALLLLTHAQDLAETAFPTAELALLHPEGSVDAPEDEAALADALAANRPRDLAAGRALIGPHRADLQAVYSAKNQPAKECSTGEQKALLISLILANARALSDTFGAPPIILLDEVAAHLDGNRRAALYDEICALKAQAWMTGTEASLFTGLADRATFLEVVESESGSEIIEST